MYADYEYYINAYLLGKKFIVPEDVYTYWEKQAEKIINQYTFNRLVRHPELADENVRDCACELVELLYQADKYAQQALEQGGFLTSYSNDGESGTFDLSQSVYTEANRKNRIVEIIRRNLMNTGLLYRGL